MNLLYSIIAFFIAVIIGRVFQYVADKNKMDNLEWDVDRMDLRVACRNQEIEGLQAELHESKQVFDNLRGLMEADTHTIDRLTTLLEEQKMTTDILRSRLTQTNHRLQREGSITNLTTPIEREIQIIDNPCRDIKPREHYTDDISSCVPEAYKGYIGKSETKIKNLTIPIEGEIRILENPCLDIKPREYYTRRNENFSDVSKCSLPGHFGRR